MNKQEMKAKIAAANRQTQINGTGSITIPVWQKWLLETKKYDFDKELINLSETLSEKLQFLLHGKPYIIEHSSENKIGEFVEQIMLQEVMFHNEKILFDKGSSYIIIEKIGSDKKPIVQLRVAEPNFPNTVTRLGNIKIRAEIWSTFKYDKVNYYQRTIYTPEKILNDVFRTDGDINNINEKDDKIKLAEFNELLPKHLRIKGETKNPWQFIPVVEVQYKPTMDFSWKGRDNIAPKNRVEKQQAFLNDATKALSLELYLNRTKILVDQDMLNTGDKEALRRIADENILGLLKDTGGVDGEGKAIEIIQGDPKVDQYWTNIKNIISLSVTSLKLSELSEEQAAASATGEIFSKGNDVETGNTLQIFRQKAITEIMTKALAIKNGENFQEHEIDTSAFNIQLIPNVIMNEAKMTDIVTKQLSAGLISMVQGKVKLEGISSEDAKNSLKEVTAEDAPYNPQLEAVASFTDNGEDADKQQGDPKDADKETGNPQPEEGK